MQDISINSKDKIIMKLLHYFITDKGYNPVVLHGIKDEIWLENLNSEYKIIRIVSNYIHNEEQLNLDIFRTQKVIKSIKKKTLSFNMETLSIFIDLSDDVSLKEVPNMDFVSIIGEKDIETKNVLTDKFPDLKQKIKFDVDGMDLLVKLTSDINSNREKENVKLEETFKEKKPILTPILLIVFLTIFLLQNAITNDFIKALFIHDDIYYLIISIFSMFLLGKKVEGFYGFVKTLIIVSFSCACGVLVSLMFDNSAGYIAISFGLMGSLINFGYYYRVYLVNILQSLIVPIALLNILFSIIYGYYYLLVIALVGMVGGYLISRALGIKYKSTKQDIINGIIMSGIYIASLVVINFI